MGKSSPCWKADQTPDTKNDMVYVVYSECCEKCEQMFDVEGVAESKEAARKIMDRCIAEAKKNWEIYTESKNDLNVNWKECVSSDTYKLIECIMGDYIEFRISRPMEVEK